MTPAQLRKYAICGGQAVAAMRRMGHSGSDQALRHFCIAQALGCDKQPGSMNNREFDEVLKVFAGYAAMSDLAEQLRLLDQPLLRAMTAATPYLDEIGVTAHGREAYVRAIYERVQARRPARGEHVFSLDEIPDRDLPLILGALHHTAEHRHGIQHHHPAAGSGRARWGHRVGHRRRDALTADSSAPSDPPDSSNRAEDLLAGVDDDTAELF